MTMLDSKVHEHTYTVLYTHSKQKGDICTSPEAGCYWLQVCYTAMTIMVMLDYMCVQSFMITYKQCFMFIVNCEVIKVNEKSCRLRMATWDRTIIVT